MKILKRIRKLYAESGRYDDFPADINAHLKHGYVLVTPTAALMGFRCRSDDVQQAMIDGVMVSPRIADEAGDCWFAWLAVGDLAEILRLIPRNAKFIAFARKNVIRLRKFEETTRLLHHVSKQIHSPLA